MSEATIRADILDAIDGISNIGVVHDYDRFTADWTAFKTLYTTTISGNKVVRGWDICYEKMAPNPPMAFDKSHNYMRTHQYVIRGYLGLYDADASAKTAALLAEDVCDALDADADLCNASKYYQNTDSLAEIRTFIGLVFGDVLCHYIEIEVKVTEFMT